MLGHDVVEVLHLDFGRWPVVLGTLPSLNLPRTTIEPACTRPLLSRAVIALHVTLLVTTRF